MKTIKNVTLYKCDYCGKIYRRKHAAEHHEKWCVANPENEKACNFCEELEETVNEFGVGYDYQGDVVFSKSKAFRCKKLKKLLYPLKVERMDLQNKYPETFEDQEPMPKICEHTSYEPLNF